jgi:hypothetical protein
MMQPDVNQGYDFYADSASLYAGDDVELCDEGYMPMMQGKEIICQLVTGSD